MKLLPLPLKHAMYTNSAFNTDRTATPGLHTSVIMSLFPLKCEGRCQRKQSCCVSTAVLPGLSHMFSCSHKVITTYAHFYDRYSLNSGHSPDTDSDLKTWQRLGVEQLKGKQNEETEPFLFVWVWNLFSPSLFSLGCFSSSLIGLAVIRSRSSWGRPVTQNSWKLVVITSGWLCLVQMKLTAAVWLEPERKKKSVLLFLTSLK